MLSRSQRAGTWVAPTLIAFVPIIIGSVYSTTIFDVIGGIDPYNFVGAGLDYDQPGFGGVGYKISRVPWILVEDWYRHALPPLAAQYAIQFSIHILLGLAVYFTLRQLLGMVPAFLGALSLLVCTELYAATSPDYMNTFADALYAVSIWFVTVASRKPFSFALYALCGAMIALTVHTNLEFLFFIPMLLVHTIILRRQAGLPNALPRIFLTAIGGGVAATIALGLVAVLNGRDFNFVQYQIHFWLTSNNEAKAIWYEPWSSGFWYKEVQEGFFGCYVAVAVAALLFALFLVRSNRRKEAVVSAQISLLVQYVYINALFAITQTLGQGAYQPNQLPHVLLVPLFMSLAAMIALMRSASSYRPAAWELVVMWALIVVPLCWHPLFSLLRGPIDAAGDPLLVCCISIAVFCLVVAANGLVRVGKPALWFLAMAFFLGVENVDVASAQARGLFQPSTCTYDRDGFLAVNDLHRILLATKPRPVDVFVWVDDKETMPLAGCGQINVGSVGWSFRSLGVGVMLTPERENFQWINWLAVQSKSLYILVASNEPDAANVLIGKFAKYHYVLRAEPVRVQEGNLKLNFWALRRPPPNT